MSDFLVPAIAPRIRHLASGVEEARRLFSFPFPAAIAADIAVYRDGVLLDGGFAVSFAADRQGGTISLDTAVPEGTEIVILRATAIERATDFVENGAFRASALNLELDRLTMIAQELELAGQAGLHRDPSEIGPDLVLPAPAARANGLLGFSADGQALTVLPVESLRGEKGDTGPQGQAGDMSGVNNLSELTDPAAARSSLDVAGWDELNAELAAMDAAIRQVDLNLALNTLRDAIEAGWTNFQMVDGFVDEFDDQNGMSVDPALTAPYWGATNGYGTLSADKITFSGPGNYWAAAMSELTLSTGKRYAEIEYVTVYAGDARYMAHGVAAVTIPGNNSWEVPGLYCLFHHGELVTNGANQGNKRDTPFTNQLGIWVPPGTKGCVAIDFDAGKGWLGFVTPWGLPWWVGNGRPEDAHNPTFTFAPNTPMRLMAFNYQNTMKLNAGQSAFANQMIPRGFIPGWFETDGVVDGPFGPNIAPTGTASSPYGGANPGNVIDQNASTTWVAGNTGTQSCIQITFATAKTVKRAVLRYHYNGLAYITQLRIRGSNDGSTWTDLASKTTGIGAAYADHVFDIAMPSAYLHYDLLADYSTANALGIGEFQLYEAVPVVDTVAGLSSGQSYDAAGDYYLLTPDIVPDRGLPTVLGGSGWVGMIAIDKQSTIPNGITITGIEINPAKEASGWYAYVVEKTGSSYWIRATYGPFDTSPDSVWTRVAASFTVPASGEFYTAVSVPVDAPYYRAGPGARSEAGLAIPFTGGGSPEFAPATGDGTSQPTIPSRWVLTDEESPSLASKAVPAQAVPIAARAVLLVDPIDDLTLNTDLICEISRDDGVSWSAGVLQRLNVFETGFQLLEMSETDLEDQPDGTAMRIRLRADASVRVKGWVLQWR